MRVQVLYFGVLKDVFGRESDEVELGEGSQVAALIELVRQRGNGSALSGVLESVAVAVNHEYARTSIQLHDGDEVALLPPVSGGLGEGGRHVG